MRRTTKRLTLLLSLASASVTGAWAQTAENGKSIKRITFDRENVCVIYADGSKEENVQALVVTGNNVTTGVKDAAPKSRATTTKRSWYTVDGRRMKAGPRVRHSRSSVCIVKEGQKVRKTIKK